MSRPSILARRGPHGHETVDVHGRAAKLSAALLKGGLDRFASFAHPASPVVGAGRDAIVQEHARNSASA
jgi:hypothetical protein